MSISKNLRKAGACALASSLLLCVRAHAGTFGSSLFTGDGDSNIAQSFDYTAKADFVGTGARSVNGVIFHDTGTSGTNYILSGITNAYGGFGNSLTGASNGLASDFYYGSTAGVSTLTLTGLTIGKSYVTTLYNAGFGDPNGRQMNITPSDTNTPFFFDENFSGNGNGNLLTYSYTATDTSISFTFSPLSPGDTYHFYAMSNVNTSTPPLSVPTISATSGAAPFTPYTVRSNDLLQTHVANVLSSGNFANESAGGVPALTDGQFTIFGGNVGQGGGNNSLLATGENGSFVEYDLDLGFSPLGYDVSSVETYGGWNDNGRDQQLFRIYYSKVGDPNFIPLGVMDYNPSVGAGTPSAIQAIFNTSLTGVDAVRFEFLNGQENGYAGYGELDVVGTATVPEPSAALAILGGAGVLMLRRRRE